MKRDLHIELGPYFNLFDRLVNKDTPRSIALAKRTFQRSSINIDKVIHNLSNNKISSNVIEILNNIEDLKKGGRFESGKFIENIHSLQKLLD